MRGNGSERPQFGSEAIHASAAMLHKVGALDEATIRNFDARHLMVPSETEPTQNPARTRIPTVRGLA